jgi:hypothetical protein
MRHYLFLSVPHAIRKYVEKVFDPVEVAGGWHEWRDSLKPDMIRLPSCTELRPYVSDDQLDPSNPSDDYGFTITMPTRRTAS